VSASLGCVRGKKQQRCDVLRAVFGRPDENFYDDVLLVDENAGFLGFIATETLFKVQNALLLTNIRELEERDREIRLKNEQMETDLRMAMELQQALMPTRIRVLRWMRARG
jgi:hypothetical protein